MHTNGESIEEREDMFPLIEELRKPFQVLLEKMREKINRGTYRWIIGDDASGRILTLIMNGVVKALYKERGFDEPTTHFFAGGGKEYPKKIDKMEEEMRRYLLQQSAREIRGALWRRKGKVRRALQTILDWIPPYTENDPVGNKEALVVTECIYTGEHIAPIAQSLRRIGIPFDVATMRSRYGREKEYLPAERVFDGQAMTDNVYGKHQLHGVEKSHKDVHATGMHGDSHRLTMLKARVDGKRLAAALVEWFNRESEPQL